MAEECRAKVSFRFRRPRAACQSKARDTQTHHRIAEGQRIPEGLRKRVRGRAVIERAMAGTVVEGVGELMRGRRRRQLRRMAGGAAVVLAAAAVDERRIERRTKAAVGGIVVRAGAEAVVVVVVPVLHLVGRGRKSVRCCRRLARGQGRCAAGLLAAAAQAMHRDRAAAARRCTGRRTNPLLVLRSLSNFSCDACERMMIMKTSRGAGETRTGKSGWTASQRPSLDGRRRA
jgi:hypothetical protein